MGIESDKDSLTLEKIITSPKSQTFTLSMKSY